jgi:hypothetical protein
MNKSAMGLLVLGLFTSVACKSNDTVANDANYEVAEVATPVTLEIAGMT